jgi:acyl-CoA thioester hydrolase
MNADPANPGFVWPVRVYWEDTDAGGIVFYANYLKFFERARTEWLRALGVEQHTLKEQTNCMFVVTETQMRYVKSARLDNLLSVSARLANIGASRLVIEQTARDAQGVLLCEGSITIAWVNSLTMKPARIPPDLALRLQTPSH